MPILYIYVYLVCINTQRETSKYQESIQTKFEAYLRLHKHLFSNTAHLTNLFL